METTYTELDLYGSINECARIDTAFLLIYEVCGGTVTLVSVSISTPEEID